ncbi:MAG: hypothetical protein IKX05_04665 [Bacteroidales bacterium]|nr:hypothetical protein [Bacteroidales bacterium]
MKRSILHLLMLVAAAACAPLSHVQKLREGQVSAQLVLSQEEELLPELDFGASPTRRDTLVVKDPEGNDVLIMKAIKDEDGNMVATDVLEAARVTARFRNVAERHGRIDLKFEVVVPEKMQDSRWQLRFYPDMFVLEDSLRLESVYITGNDYRKAQLRGYEQYDRFIRSIITDTTKFIDLRNLELFLQRNIPQLYQFKRDSTFVSDEQFCSQFGVTEQQAIDHYTDMFAWKRNEYRKSRQGAMYAKYVKVPIQTEGLRLDTVMQAVNGDFVYQYTQTITTRPQLRKVDIVLSGDVFESDHRIYTMKRSEPLTFYISSLSAFVDGTEKYLTTIRERRAAANTACYVDFAQGRSDIDLSLGNNRSEMGRIRGNITELLENRQFDLDSIIIAASASPEGALSTNLSLSERRAAAVANYFDTYVRHYRDSLRRNSFALSVGEDGSEKLSQTSAAIPFRSRSNGENWEMLSLLVDEDTLLTSSARQSYMKHLSEADPDRREEALKGESYYTYLREKLYPRLRTVKFDFYLHRKGMIKDTVHTTQLDTVYMKGVEALKERDYKQALEYLRPYKDYNTAIAYVSLDYNASAMSILQELERTPQVTYMLAVLHARSGDDQAAVQCYLDACRADRSFVFRGNLDPEIFALIQRYNLNKQTSSDEEII